MRCCWQGARSSSAAVRPRPTMLRINWKKSLTSKRWNRWASGRPATLFAAWIFAIMGAVNLHTAFTLHDWHFAFQSAFWTIGFVIVIFRLPRRNSSDDAV